MLCRSMVLGAMLLPAGVVTAQVVRSVLDIPAQPLVKALQQFADQTGLQLAYETRLANGQYSSPVRGVSDPAEALQLLLVGTQLKFEFLDERTVGLSARSSLITNQETVNHERAASRLSLAALIFGVLQSVAAPAQSVASDPETIETVNVFGTLNDEVNIGSKDGLSLKDTPKSVTIVSRERIEAQNLSTIADVMKQTTGVTVRDYGPVGGWFFSRGYRVLTTQVDGGAPITDGFGKIASPDSAIFERVEVLRGVDGLFSGAGDPGGVINLVRKRASATPGLHVNTSIGRWDNYRVEADLTGPLTSDGRVRGRTVGVYEDRGYFWDRASSRKTLIYGVLESDIGDSTVVSLGGSYERGHHNASDFSGVPFSANGSSLGLPRSTSLAADWSDREVTTKEIFAKLEHTFANDTVVRMNVSHQRQDNDTAELYVRGPVDPVTLIIPGGAFGTGAAGSAATRHPEQTVLDVFVKGGFQLFSREHSFVVGADYAQMSGDGERGYNLVDYPWGDRRPVDVFNFNPADYPSSARVLTSYNAVNRQTQSGVYATLGLQLADPLRLTVGARYSDYERKSESYYADDNGVLDPNVSYGANYSDNVLVPSVAVTYELSANWSLYGSYAQSFAPQASLLEAPLPGTPMDAITGEGYEIGVKGTAFDGVNVALALYQVLRSGEGLRDPAYPYTPGERGSACCFISTGDVTTQGLDLEFSGQILSGWQLFAGYTYSERESSKAASNAFTGTSLYFNWTPKHLFKTWTTWNLPGSLSKWTLNAGVQAQSKISGYTFWPALGLPRQSGYAVWNASVQYRPNEHWSAALYAENLFDKTYYEAISTVRSEGMYGVPRNLVLRLQYKF